LFLYNGNKDGIKVIEEEKVKLETKVQEEETERGEPGKKIYIKKLIDNFFFKR
jgi:hypothetical protein